MDRRTIVALVLVAAVIVLTPRLFPGRPRSQPSALIDTTRNRVPSSDSVAKLSRTESKQLEAAPATRTPDTTAAASRARADSIVLGDAIAAFHFSSVGASIQGVELKGFRALRPGGGNLWIRSVSEPLLRFRGVTANDTIAFDQVVFGIQSRSADAKNLNAEFRGGIGTDSLTIRYTVVPDSFVVHIAGALTGRLSQTGAGFLLLQLPPTLQSFEADSVDDQRHLAFAFMPSRDDAKGIPFGKLDPGERRIAPGPHQWIALKNKYFIMGTLARPKDSVIAEFSATGLARTSRIATRAQGVAVLRPTNGQFALDLYTGPQQWKRLHSLGRGFENSNPYGGFLQPVVQPFARIVLQVLLWMHENLSMSYGWVLVIFGVAVRLVLWPLNQSAMRSSLKMQRIQPELNDLQKRYKNDPQKLQSEMMRVYKEHGMSPFSMFSGCLPLLLPMPVLFALFFVFQNTIEFRGVSFLWLHDISQKDPFYLLPIAMGISMFVLTWIGSRNAPPNPQTKTMGYVFPVMMTFLLANLAAGLNLYYAVQNLAALPQQWLIANERARAGVGKTSPQKK
jgi:YidC/Oxa1 family membrane protein insertase